jgi:iron complex transport system ATP-binding protein
VTDPVDEGPVAEGLAAEALVVRLGGRAVVDHVGLALRPGEVTAIVGPNGAGKSTLMSCLAGLRRPERGAVSLGGRPIAALDDRERARRVGYLPQTPEIAWRLDVRTFVRLGRTAHTGLFGEGASDVAAVDRALESTAMTAFAERDITTLSGGERARALIARALAGEPTWLLADEPLTGLDLGHQLDAADLLRRIAQGGVGVVVTLHDLSFAARAADRIVVMAQGRILADGPPVEALSPDVLKRAYAVSARWVTGASGPLLDIVGRDV